MSHDSLLAQQARSISQCGVSSARGLTSRDAERARARRLAGCSPDGTVAGLLAYLALFSRACPQPPGTGMRRPDTSPNSSVIATSSVITETHRIGGITDTSDFTTTGTAAHPEPQRPQRPVPEHHQQHREMARPASYPSGGLGVQRSLGSAYRPSVARSAMSICSIVGSGTVPRNSVNRFASAKLIIRHRA